jgi:FkbM family methyltransferase
VTLSDLKKSYAAALIGKPEYIEAMHEMHATLFEYPALIGDADVDSIVIDRDGIVLKTRAAGILLRLDPTDQRLIPIEILNFGAYELEETEIFLALAEGQNVVFDVGANIGWYSLNVAKRYGSALTVHAFEPLPATYRQLVANVELNHADCVVTHNLGMAAEDAVAVFNYYPEGSGNASLADLSGRASVSQVECEIRTLDGFVKESGVAPDVIKCDVEGAELMVFRGAADTIASAKPAVFTEMLRKWSASFGYSPNDIIEWFAERGYRCFAVAEGRLTPFTHMTDETESTNFVFLHPARHGSLITGLVADKP